jgi:hypothetical protein
VDNRRVRLLGANAVQRCCFQTLLRKRLGSGKALAINGVTLPKEGAQG